LDKKVEIRQTTASAEVSDLLPHFVAQIPPTAETLCKKLEIVTSPKIVECL